MDNSVRTTEPGTRMEPISVLKMALDTLAQRVYRWTVLGMGFTLFAYAVWKPEPWRLAAASIFVLLVHVPLAWKERAGR